MIDSRSLVLFLPPIFASQFCVRLELIYDNREIDLDYSALRAVRYLISWVVATERKSILLPSNCQKEKALSVSQLQLDFLAILSRSYIFFFQIFETTALVNEFSWQTIDSFLQKNQD